jgi:hypothetical protein
MSTVTHRGFRIRIALEQCVYEGGSGRPGDGHEHVIKHAERVIKVNDCEFSPALTDLVKAATDIAAHE